MITGWQEKDKRNSSTSQILPTVTNDFLFHFLLVFMRWKKRKAVTGKDCSWLRFKNGSDKRIVHQVILNLLFLGHLPHAFSFLPLACDSKKKMAKGYRRGMTAGGPFFLVTATTTRNVATINRGNENFLVIIGAVNGSSCDCRSITQGILVTSGISSLDT